MVDFTVVVCILTGAVSVFFFKQWLGSRKYPPGPWGLPVFGHLPLLGRSPEAKYLEWWVRYGDIVRIRFGSWNAVVVNGYNAVKEALERSDDAFSGRPDFVTQVALREAFGGLDALPFATFSSEYLQLSKLTATALRNYMTKCDYSCEELFQEEAVKLTEKLRRYHGDQPVSVTSDIEMSVQSVIYQMLYGKGKEDEIKPYVKQIVEASTRFSEFVGSGNIVDVIPWLRYFMNHKVERFKKAVLELDWIARANMKEHKASFKKDKTRDVLDALCSLANDLPAAGVTGLHLMHQITSVQGAGFDTTLRTTMFIILYMSSFPQVQKRVQEEIDEVLGNGKKVSWRDREHLPYVNATIYEVMRKTCTVPFAIPHYTMFDTKLRGYDIDKDTVVLFNLHSVANEKSFWGDPENFRPERLLGENGQLDTEKCSHILSFSAGRRRCIGEMLAKMNIFITLTTLMQRCTFKKEEGYDLDLEPVRGLSYSPKPFKVIVGGR